MNKEITRILLVDDEPDTCRNIEITLQRAGYQVKVAHGIKTALNSLKLENFDLALFDMVMPDLTGKLSKRAGLFLLKEVRNIGYDLPVIMLTATKDSTLMAEILHVHKASDYLEKSDTSQRKLLQTIKNTISHE